MIQNDFETKPFKPRVAFNNNKSLEFKWCGKKNPKFLNCLQFLQLINIEL
jgi:hypothetical protein